MLVACDGEDVVGVEGWMRWRVRAQGRVFELMRGVDLAVDAAHRGQGVYALILGQAPKYFRPETAFTFSNPNMQSRPGSLKSGRHEVGRFPLFVRPCASIARRTHVLEAAEPAAQLLGDAASVRSLLSEADESGDRLATVKDVDYLRWRYGLPSYRAVVDERGGRLAGMAIFRVRSRGRRRAATVCELLVARGDHRLARRLLGRVVRAARADYLTCHFPPGSTPLSAALRSGFVRTRRGLVATVHPLREQLVPDPTSPESWALCLGDLDLL